MPAAAGADTCAMTRSTRAYVFTLGLAAAWGFAAGLVWLPIPVWAVVELSLAARRLLPRRAYLVPGTRYADVTDDASFRPAP